LQAGAEHATNPSLQFRSEWRKLMSDMNYVERALLPAAKAIVAAIKAQPGDLTALAERAKAVQADARAIFARNSERANELEDQKAALEAQIERLDYEGDQAWAIVEGLGNTLAGATGGDTQLSA
jgi:hypothetical protein